MTPGEVLPLFLSLVPSAPKSHMLCGFVEEASRGNFYPFTQGLFEVLADVDSVSPGYAAEMLRRIGAVKGTGEEQYEALTQSCAELYVTAGLAVQADRGPDGKALFSHEPGASAGKNPEFECCVRGFWLAVEVKAPKLIAFRKKQAADPFQMLARIPNLAPPTPTSTLPRDNPVKDFVVSAEAKFAAYEPLRPEAYRVLSIVWDDFCNEPISALLSPTSGLLTPRSFHKDGAGTAVQYPHVDAIVVCRYQHQIRRATRLEPLADGLLMPLRYRHEGFPFKALVAVPGGRTLPDELIDALNAVPLHPMLGAEYVPSEIVFWNTP